MDFSIELQGGIGKHVMYSSFIKWLNEKFPDSKITVVSGYPEIFENNPRIWRNLPAQQAYLFEDYLKNTDFRKGDPYHRQEFFREKDKMHFNEICPIAYGFNEYNTNPHNEIFLTKGERMEFMEMENKKCITLQVSGGIPPGINMNIREKMDSAGRDIPLPMALKIVNILKSRGYEVIQIRSPVEQIIPGTTQLGSPISPLPFRNTMSVGIHCKGHIGGDSSYMHAMAAFEKPMLIFWGQTHVDNLGYKYPGVINVSKPGSMTYRPQVGMPDRTALFPFKDPNEDMFFSYTDEELRQFIDKFLEQIK